MYLTEILKKRKKEELFQFIANKTYQDLHNYLSYLHPRYRVIFFRILSPKIAAPILEAMPDESEIIRIISKVSSKIAANILKNFSSDIQVDILRELEPPRFQRIINYFPKKNRKNITSNIIFADNTAGGLMISEFLKYRNNLQSNDIKEDLEKNSDKYKDFDVQYTYIVDKNERLVGIIPIRSLLLAKKNTQLEEITRKEVIFIPVDASIDKIRSYFEKYNFLAFPILNPEGKLLGVLTKNIFDHFMQKETSQEILKLTGIPGGEEFRSQPIYYRSRKRLAWLSINIFLNFLAASVIIAYEGTLAQVITLAVFLPIISDMSGCSGNQSVAVTLREIALGLISPKEIFKVLGKEIILGFINGFILGSLIALIAIIWKGNIYLGLVVGLALALNTIMAVCLGSAIPIILKSFKIDPAIASSPILTTVTDMSGFLLIFLLARQFLAYLT